MRDTVARQRIVSRFVQAGALSPDHAIAFVPDVSAIATFRRMRRCGAVATDADGRHWLDAERLRRFRGAHRRRLVAWIVSSGIAATAAATTAVLTLID